MQHPLDPDPWIVRDDLDTVTVVSERDRRSEHAALAARELNNPDTGLVLIREGEWITDKGRRAISTTWQTVD